MYAVKENNQYLHYKGFGITFKIKKKATEFAKSYNKTFIRQAYVEKTTRNKNVRLPI